MDCRERTQEIARKVQCVNATTLCEEDGELPSRFATAMQPFIELNHHRDYCTLQSISMKKLFHHNFHGAACE
jgi:hypothetical protein